MAPLVLVGSEVLPVADASMLPNDARPLGLHLQINGNVWFGPEWK